jgi:hypothetical protein
MNRSYSKIRHIQESNQILEKRILSEQTSITESRLENIVFKYLDGKLEGAELIDGEGQFCDIVLIFPDEDFGLLGWKKPGQWPNPFYDPIVENELWTDFDFVSDVMEMFSLDESDALDIIVSYVKSRYNWNVSSDHVRMIGPELMPTIYSLFVGTKDHVDDYFSQPNNYFDDILYHDPEEDMDDIYNRRKGLYR